MRRKTEGSPDWALADSGRRRVDVSDMSMLDPRGNTLVLRFGKVSTRTCLAWAELGFVPPKTCSSWFATSSSGGLTSVVLWLMCELPWVACRVWFTEADELLLRPTNVELDVMVLCSMILRLKIFFTFFHSFLWRNLPFFGWASKLVPLVRHCWRCSVRFDRKIFPCIGALSSLATLTFSGAVESVIISFVWPTLILVAMTVKR